MPHILSIDTCSSETMRQVSLTCMFVFCLFQMVLSGPINLHHFLQAVAGIFFLCSDSGSYEISNWHTGVPGIRSK